MSKTKTFTVTEFIKDNTFAVTSRLDTEQIALIAAYTAAGYTATVLGTGLEAGPAKTLKGEAITILQAAGKILVTPGDRPAAEVAPEVRAARKAARLAAKTTRTPKASALKVSAASGDTYEQALAKKKKAINARVRAEKEAARKAADVTPMALKMAAPKMEAPVPVDPVVEARRAARKEAIQATKAARAPKLAVKHTLTSVTTEVPKK